VCVSVSMYVPTVLYSRPANGYLRFRKHFLLAARLRHFMQDALQAPAQLRQERREKDPLTRFIARFYACLEMMPVTNPSYTLQSSRRHRCPAVYSIAIALTSSYKSTQGFYAFSTFSVFFAVKITFFSPFISFSGNPHVLMQTILRTLRMFH
jgi:hypothetical protein